MANPSEFRSAAGSALPVQVAWAILSAIWNVAGVWMIAQGQRAPGPTASVAGAAVLLALALGWVAAVRRWPLGYLLLSIVAVVASLGAVVNAFTGDPALWPSEFWRYAGIVLNSVGFLACAFAIAAYFRWRTRR